MLINEFNIIKHKIMSKQITYEEGKLLAKPIIKQINEKAVEIAKKYNMRPKKVSFAGLMR